MRIGVGPLVSVIMPCWNRERFIADAIGSVLAQTFTNFELLVVDDGSSDGTRGVVSSFSDSRIRLIAREHRGISATMNAGLAAAEGRYLSRLDSDDMWLPDMLETQVAVLDARPAIGLVYARAEVTDENWRPVNAIWGNAPRYPGDSLRSMLADATCHMTWVCRRECFDRVGVFDEQMVTGEDWDMWLRIARHYPFAFTDRVLARTRLHRASITSPHSPDYDGELARRTAVLDKLYASPGLPPEILAMKGEAYSNIHTTNGLLWLGQRKLRRALGAFGRAVAVSDSRVFTAARIAWSGIKWNLLAPSRAGRGIQDLVSSAARRWRSR